MLEEKRLEEKRLEEKRNEIDPTLFSQIMHFFVNHLTQTEQENFVIDLTFENEKVDNEKVENEKVIGYSYSEKKKYVLNWLRGLDLEKEKVNIMIGVLEKI
jgi:hypothetical protein